MCLTHCQARRDHNGTECLCGRFLIYNHLFQSTSAHSKDLLDPVEHIEEKGKDIATRLAVRQVPLLHYLYNIIIVKVQ